MFPDDSVLKMQELLSGIKNEQAKTHEKPNLIRM